MDWISSLLLATVRLAIPLLLISLAELYGQRAGMVNIGLEGLAAIGALVGFLMCYITGSNWIGLLCGALAGLLVNMIYAFSTDVYKRQPLPWLNLGESVSLSTKFSAMDISPTRPCALRSSGDVYKRQTIPLSHRTAKTPISRCM